MKQYIRTYSIRSLIIIVASSLYAISMLAPHEAFAEPLESNQNEVLQEQVPQEQTLQQVTPQQTASQDAQQENSSQGSTFQEIESLPTIDEPRITNVVVTGTLNEEATDTHYFDNVHIYLEAEHITDDNLLTKEGLHWSDVTTTESLNAQSLGIFDKERSFGKENSPLRDVSVYPTFTGSSGRITHVGKTISGIDLDLVWTIVDSDTAEWQTYSNFQDGHIKGIGFTGEQYIPGATGNSIVVLYNNASFVSMNYTIVRHGTFVEQPVILSFITTDIDAGQGVFTNLANLAEIIPNNKNLTKDAFGVIYDTTPGVVSYNGSKDLPFGGYLGAGFLSSFTYTFFAPAPDRITPDYRWPIGVRYDLFGSALQAKISTTVAHFVQVNYVDTTGTKLQESNMYKTFDKEVISLVAPRIPKYVFVTSYTEYPSEFLSNITYAYKDLTPIANLSHKAVSAVDTAQQNYNSKNTPIPNANYKMTAPYQKNAPYQYYIPYNQTIGPSQRQGYVVHEPHNNVLTPVLPHDVTYSGFQNIEENLFSHQDKTKQFFDYLHEVEKKAQAKYGNNINKINHEIANAIAYSSYNKDFNQGLVNSFDYSMLGTSADDDFWNLMDDLHDNDPYEVDLPHIATTLAAMYPELSMQEVIQAILGTEAIPDIRRRPFASLFSDKNNRFLMLNSFVGDALTHMDEKDYRSDMDIYILYYHPVYGNKNISLRERLIAYYGNENLEVNRERFFKEALESRSILPIPANVQYAIDFLLGLLSLGGILLFAKTKIKPVVDAKIDAVSSASNAKPNITAQKDTKTFSQTLSSITKSLKQTASKYIAKPLKKLGTQALSLAKKAGASLANVGKKIINTPVAKKVTSWVQQSVKTISKTSSTFVKKAPSLTNTFVSKVVKPAASFVNKTVISPVKKFVSKRLVKPISKLFKRK